MLENQWLLSVAELATTCSLSSIVAY